MPSEGPHKGHIIEVVNPEVTLMHSHPAMKEMRPGVFVPALAQMEVSCVMVRCSDCFDSFSFPEAAELSEDERITMLDEDLNPDDA